jgi:hypothetical protein
VVIPSCWVSEVVGDDWKSTHLLFLYQRSPFHDFALLADLQAQCDANDVTQQHGESSGDGDRLCQQNVENLRESLSELSISARKAVYA